MPRPIKPMHLLEKEAIFRSLSRYNGDPVKACAALEISLSTFYRRIKKYQIDVSKFKKGEK